MSEARSSEDGISTSYKLVCLGAILRLGLQSLFKDSLTRRVELVNPLTSWYRLQECATLSTYDILPYSSDLCHHPPLLITFIQTITGVIQPAYLFLLLDILIGVLLYATAHDFTRVLLEQQKADEETHASDVGPLLLNVSKVQHMPIAVLSFYLFNPWTILTCLSQSTEVFSNFFIALTLCCLLKKKYSCACLFVAASTYLSFYPLLMLSPLVLHTLLNSSSKIYDAVKSVLITMVCLCGLLWASYATYESWDFIGSVYGFILRAPDLTPNIGLFWYLFEEMFDHFKLFYLRVYQLNVFIYLIPVTIIFRKVNNSINSISFKTLCGWKISRINVGLL